MWGIGVVVVVVAVLIPVLPAVRVPAANLRDRLAVVVRPPVARVLVVTVFGVLAGSDIQMVRLPIAHAPTVRDFPLDRRCTRTVVDVGETTLVLPDLSRLAEATAASL